MKSQDAIIVATNEDLGNRNIKIELYNDVVSTTLGLNLDCSEIAA
jgi:hypothetical protein